MAQSRAKRNSRDYSSEYKNYHSRPEQIKNRSNRNKARRMMADEGLVHKGDRKDVAHIKPLIKGGGNSRANFRINSRARNRSFRRTRNAGMR